jgi:hypothetical protein
VGLERVRVVNARRLSILAVTVAALALPPAGPAATRTGGAQATVAVVVLGAGGVTSTPAGISCPGRCAATFPAGTRVRLVPRGRNGAAFQRWGGSCAGAGACTVKPSALAAVAAQFGPAKRAPAPAPAKTAVEPGLYSLQNNSYRTFFVLPGGGSVVNIAIGSVPIACAPAATGAPSSDTLVIARAAIRPDGSFAATGTQSGVFAGARATFTYSFAGRFTAATATQPAGATGSFREDVVFTDNVEHRCTSNAVSWSAAKSGPIPQASSLVKAGKYSLANNSYRTFSVAPGGRAMLNVAIGSVRITCLPAARGVPSSVEIVIPETAIGADGSFEGKATQSGVLAGAPATITSTFSGWFQGQSRSGYTVAAGVLRLDVSFTDAGGTAHACTSNTLPWTATD